LKNPGSKKHILMEMSLIINEFVFNKRNKEVNHEQKREGAIKKKDKRRVKEVNKRE